MLYRTHQKLTGFTLIELLVVVTVLGLLVAIGLVAWRGVDDRAFNTRVQHDVFAFKTGFELYAATEKRYPSVPQTGNYCLGTGGLTGAEMNTRFGTSLPATITAQGVTATSYFCRDLTSPGLRHAIYPPLSRDLNSVMSVNKPNDNADYLVTPTSGGVYVSYSNDTNLNRPTIRALFAGGTCPSGLVNEWTNGKVAVCSVTLQKGYPVTLTGEAWPYSTASS